PQRRLWPCLFRRSPSRFRRRLREFTLCLPAESLPDCQLRKSVQRHQCARSICRQFVQPARRLRVLPVYVADRQANRLRMFRFESTARRKNRAHQFSDRSWPVYAKSTVEQVVWFWKKIRNRERRSWRRTGRHVWTRPRRPGRARRPRRRFRRARSRRAGRQPFESSLQLDVIGFSAEHLQPREPVDAGWQFEFAAVWAFEWTRRPALFPVDFEPAHRFASIVQFLNPVESRPGTGMKRRKKV